MTVGSIVGEAVGRLNLVGLLVGLRVGSSVSIVGSSVSTVGSSVAIEGDAEGMAVDDNR